MFSTCTAKQIKKGANEFAPLFMLEIFSNNRVGNYFFTPST